MMIKRFATICLFFFLFLSTSMAASHQLSRVPSTITAKVENLQPTNSLERQWQQNHSTKDRASFPTRTGFVLMRKEDIISMAVDPITGFLRIKYSQRGQLKNILSPINLKKAASYLAGFPFLKVSRSALVNVNEIDQFDGTRRGANVLMSDGSKVKVSRQVAAPLHDWLKGLSA